MGKESITLSMELAKTQCYEFECFEDNYSLTISTQGCRINTRKFNTKGTQGAFLWEDSDHGRSNEPMNPCHEWIHCNIEF